MSLENTVEFLKKHEGFRSEAYLDSAGIPTIGFGATTYPDGRKVKLGDTITKENANTMLIERTKRDYNFVKNLAQSNNVQLSDGQLAALTSFTYNVGTGILGGNTGIGKAFRSGDLKTVEQKLPQYNKVTEKGKLVPIQGLTNRRNAELNLWRGGASSVYKDPINNNNSGVNENYASVGLTPNQATAIKSSGLDPLDLDADFNEISANHEALLREISKNPAVTPTQQPKTPVEETNEVYNFFLEKNKGALQHRTPDMLFQDEVVARQSVTPTMSGGSTDDGLFQHSADYFSKHPWQKMLTKMAPNMGMFMALHAPATAAGTGLATAGATAGLGFGPLAPIASPVLAAGGFVTGYGSVQFGGQMAASSLTNKVVDNTFAISKEEATGNAVSAFMPGIGLQAQKVKQLSPLLKKGIALATGTDVMGKRTVGNVATNVIAGGTSNVVEEALTAGLTGNEFTTEDAGKSFALGVGLAGAVEGGQAKLRNANKNALKDAHSRVFKREITGKPLQPNTKILPEQIQVAKVEQLSKAAIENQKYPELAQMDNDNIRTTIERNEAKIKALRSVVESIGKDKDSLKKFDNLKTLILDPTFSKDIKAHEAEVKRVEDLSAKIADENFLKKDSESGKPTKDIRLDEYRKILTDKIALIESHTQPLKTEFTGRMAASDLSAHDAAVEQSPVINDNPAFQAVFNATPEQAQAMLNLYNEAGLIGVDKTRLKRVAAMVQSSAQLAQAPRERVLDAMEAFMNTDKSKGATIDDLYDYVNAARRDAEFNNGQLSPEAADAAAVLDLGQLLLGDNARIPMSKELAEKIKPIAGNVLKFTDNGGMVEVTLAGENTMSALSPKPPEPIADALKVVQEHIEMASVKSHNGMVTLDLIDAIRLNDDVALNNALKTGKFDIKDGLITPTEVMDLSAQVYFNSNTVVAADKFLNEVTRTAYGSFFDSSGQKITYTTHLQHVAMDMQRSRAETNTALALAKSSDPKAQEKLNDIILDKHARYMAERLHATSNLNDADLYTSVREATKVIKEKLIKEGVTGDKIIQDRMANQTVKHNDPRAEAVFDILERGGFSGDKKLHQVATGQAQAIIDNFEKVYTNDVPKTMMDHLKNMLRIPLSVLNPDFKSNNSRAARTSANALRRYLSRSGLMDVGTAISKDKNLRLVEKASRMVASRILTSTELNAVQFWSEGMGNLNQAYAIDYMNNFKTPDVPGAKLNKAQKNYLKDRGLDVYSIFKSGEGNSADRYGVTDADLNERNLALEVKSERRFGKSAVEFEKGLDLLTDIATLPFKFASSHLRAKTIERALIITDKQIESGKYNHITRDELFDNNLARMFDLSKQGDRNMLAPVLLGSNPSVFSDPRHYTMAIDNLANSIYTSKVPGSGIAGMGLKFINDTVLTRFIGYFPELISSQNTFKRLTMTKYARMKELKANPSQYFRTAVQDLAGVTGYMSAFGIASTYTIGLITNTINAINEVVNSDDETKKVEAIKNLNMWNSVIGMVAPDAEQLDMDKFSADPAAYLSMVISNHNEALNILTDLLDEDKRGKDAPKKLMVVEGLKDIGRDLATIKSAATSKDSINEKLDDILTATMNLTLGQGKTGNIKEAGVLLKENTPVFSGKRTLGLGEIYSGNTPGSKLSYINPETHEALRENVAYKSLMLGAKLAGINTEVESDRSKEFIKEAYRAEFVGEAAQFLEEL
jgi:lysozyme